MASASSQQRNMFQKAAVAPVEDSPRRAGFGRSFVVATNSDAGCSESSPMVAATSTSSLAGGPQRSPHDSINSSTSVRWFKVRAAVSASGAITKAIPTPAPRPQPKKIEREDSFLKKFSTTTATRAAPVAIDMDGERDQQPIGCLRRLRLMGAAGVRRLAQVRQLLFSVIQPKSFFMFFWLGAVTMAVLYNLWTTIARQAFPELVGKRFFVWLGFDCFFDLIYLADIVVQLKTGCFDKGIMVQDPRRVAAAYLRSRSFILDAAALVPLDVVQLWIGLHPMLRFPRFLKVYRCLEWNMMMENWTPYPNFWRVLNLSHVVCLGCHWFAAFYYLISKAEGFNSKWGYPEPKDEYATVTRKYLKSLYWSTLTLTTIGDLFPPESNSQHLFTIGTYLIGVFVFASIVGQVGNVINNRNQSRQEYETMLDNAKSYMRQHSVPSSLQRRVQTWYEYAWNRGKLNGGGDLYSALGMLPERLKTEIALHVNLDTLRKVTIFQSCRPEFLHELVLKMKTLICCEGDFVCRKGEVAREMFIIADGILEVISEAGEVVSKMSSGDFFGEIGILNLEGGVNRRTADVRSVGYSELFVLSRNDVLDALKDHPDAEAVIREYGIRRLKEMAARKAKPVGNTPSILPGATDADRTDMSKAQSAASLLENSQPGSVTTLAAAPATGAEAPNAPNSAGVGVELPPTVAPENVRQVVTQLRTRRPFQGPHSNRMPFIDEDGTEGSRDAELACARAVAAVVAAATASTTDGLSSRRAAAVAAVLRHVSAVTDSPSRSAVQLQLQSSDRSLCLVERKCVSSWPAKDPTLKPSEFTSVGEAKQESLVSLLDDRIKELQFENGKKQQEIECLHHRIAALQRLVVKNCKLFDSLLGSGATAPAPTNANGSIKESVCEEASPKSKSLPLQSADQNAENENKNENGNGNEA